MPQTNIRKLKISYFKRGKALVLLSRGLKIDQVLRQLKNKYHKAYTLAEIKAAYFPKPSTNYISDLENAPREKILKRYIRIKQTAITRSNSLKQRWTSDERDALMGDSFNARPNDIRNSAQNSKQTNVAHSEGAKRRWKQLDKQGKIALIAATNSFDSAVQRQRSRSYWFDEHLLKLNRNILTELQEANCQVTHTSGHYLLELSGAQPGTLHRITPKGVPFGSDKLYEKNSSEAHLFSKNGKLLVMPTQGNIVVDSGEEIEVISAAPKVGFHLNHGELLTIGQGEHSSKFRVISVSQFARKSSR